MGSKMKQTSTSETATITSVHPLRIISIVFILLIVISFCATWYARQVSIPRYCENPDLNILHLEQLLTSKQPAGDGSRRPYIISAKLLFLVPQQTNEAVPDYIQRVRTRLYEQCH